MLAMEVAAEVFDVKLRSLLVGSMLAAACTATPPVRTVDPSPYQLRGRVAFVESQMRGPTDVSSGSHEYEVAVRLASGERFVYRRDDVDCRASVECRAAVRDVIARHLSDFGTARQEDRNVDFRSNQRYPDGSYALQWYRLLER